MRTFHVEFSDEAAAATFCERLPGSWPDGAVVRFDAVAKDVNAAFRAMDGLKVVSLSENHPDLEDYFMNTLQDSSAKEGQ